MNFKEYLEETNYPKEIADLRKDIEAEGQKLGLTVEGSEADFFDELRGKSKELDALIKKYGDLQAQYKKSSDEKEKVDSEPPKEV